MAGFNLLRTPSSLVVSRVLASMLMLVTAPIIARAIGPDGRGITAAAIAALTLAPYFVGFGLPWAVRRRAAVSTSPYDVGRTAQLLTVFTVVPAALIAFGADQTIFGELTTSSRTALAIGFILSPTLVLRNNVVSLFVVDRNYLSIFWLTIAQPTSYVIFIGAVAASGQLDPASTIAAFIASTAVSAILTEFLRPFKYRGQRVDMKPLLLESLKAAGGQLAEVSSQRLDQVLLLPLIGPVALGHYAVAANVASAPNPVGQAIGASAFSSIANEKSDPIGAVVTSLRRGIALGFLCGATVAIVSPFAIPLVFGREFSESVVSAEILAIGTLFTISASTLTSAMFAINKGVSVTVSQFGGLLIGLGVMLWAAPNYGSVGAACAAITGYLATFLLGCALTRVPVLRIFPRPSDFSLALKDITRKRASTLS
ncbi:MAG: oligosaccharide flippase family protein [Rhodococcus sp. (in: high G+C Gram-positive bacteria)]|nr:oligosaccharide flippase family protein [Rhodococcus sp. (in: high G+C Gram-positive bacteria)]MDI6629534.1 oligosaccharide flippase family protein [Rhodococcus sp. (in: high G+C Gram-positive bacteria)]